MGEFPLVFIFHAKDESFKSLMKVSILMKVFFKDESYKFPVVKLSSLAWKINSSGNINSLPSSYYSEEKKLAHIISQSLFSLINSSIYEYEFPLIFQSGKIIPAHKSGKTCKVNNYSLYQYHRRCERSMKDAFANKFQTF